MTGFSEFFGRSVLILEFSLNFVSLLGWLMCQCDFSATVWFGWFQSACIYMNSDLPCCLIWKLGYLTKMTIKSWKSRRRDWLLTSLSWTNPSIDYRFNQWEQSSKSKDQSEYREHQLYSIFKNINDCDFRAFLW